MSTREDDKLVGPPEASERGTLFDTLYSEVWAFSVITSLAYSRLKPLAVRFWEKLSPEDQEALGANREAVRFNVTCRRNGDRFNHFPYNSDVVAFGFYVDPGESEETILKDVPIVLHGLDGPEHLVETSEEEKSLIDDFLSDASKTHSSLAWYFQAREGWGLSDAEYALILAVENKVDNFVFRDSEEMTALLGQPAA